MINAPPGLSDTGDPNPSSPWPSPGLSDTGSPCPYRRSPPLGLLIPICDRMYYVWKHDLLADELILKEHHGRG